ncbi:MAG: thermonuclease family protein [Candidatus Xenobiia bacterium LiM19]
MKKSALYMMIIIMFLTSSVYAQDFSGKVLAVTDSNNISILNNSGSAVTVRLYCIACPAQGQPYYKDAVQYLQNLIVGKNVDVDVKWQDYDNKQVSKISLNGSDVGAQIAGAGLAWYDSKVYQDGDVAAAVAQAQSKKTAIWSQPNPVAPWDYLSNKSGVVPNTSGGITNNTDSGYSAPAANKNLDKNTSWDQNNQPLDSSPGYYNPYQYGNYGGGVYNPASHQNFCNYCNNYHTTGGCVHTKH